MVIKLLMTKVQLKETSFTLETNGVKNIALLFTIYTTGTRTRTAKTFFRFNYLLLK